MNDFELVGGRISRYQVLRRVGCDPLTAGFIALLNWARSVPAGQIVFLSVLVEYDASEAA